MKKISLDENNKENLENKSKKTQVGAIYLIFTEDPAILWESLLKRERQI